MIDRILRTIKLLLLICMMSWIRTLSYKKHPELINVMSPDVFFF